MKITDVTTSVSNNDAQEKKEETSHEEPISRKRTLLEKFNIPVEHLDFDFVKNCEDWKKVERILRILRSGEEGCYPDLEKFVSEKLEKLNPGSRLLRVETPVIHSNELGDAEKETLTRGLSDWLTTLSGDSEENQGPTKSRIFHPDECLDDDGLHEFFPLPVRGTTTTAPSINHSNEKVQSSQKRIKSWEYDKWDKYNVDAELMKLDITDMQNEEWEKREKPKLLQEQKQIEKLMRQDVPDNVKDHQQTQEKKKVSKVSKSSIKSIAKPKVEKNIPEKSYIEEVDFDSDDDDETGTTVRPPSYFKSSESRERKNIVIDDLHMPI